MRKIDRMTTYIANPPIPFPDAGLDALRLSPAGPAYVLDPSRPVLVHSRALAAGSVITRHAHPRAQLLQAVQGLLRIKTGGAIWLVPPGFGVWIPGGAVHEVTIETAARTANIYVDPSITVRPGQTCEVVPVSPLLRLLIQRMLDETHPDRLNRLGAVACDEISAAEPAPLNLPVGQDARLRRVTTSLARNPGDPRPLPALAAEAATSPRTLERLFRAETGLGFRDWRSRARLLQAVAQLERGETSTRIAYGLGYRSVSAFVAAFRQQFGCAPQAYLDRPNRTDPNTDAGKMAQADLAEAVTSSATS